MMKRNTWFYCFLLLVLLVSSTGCQAAVQVSPTPTNTLEPPLPTPTPTAIYQTIDGIPLGANLNCPDRAAFGYIKENIPVKGVLVNSPILIRWYYIPVGGAPADWSSTCVPTSFTLYLSPGPGHTNVTAYPVTSVTVKNLVNLLMYSIQFNEVLPDHTSYRWMVVGHADGIDLDEDQLPLLQDDSAWKVYNNSSVLLSQFQTGPVCDPLTISPVNLLNPPDEAALETDAPFFQWEMPDCTGQAFLLSFDTEPQMTNPDRGWVTSLPEFLMSSEILQPCVKYYWQVKAGLYSVDYHLSQGDWATTSQIRSFSIRSAACPDGWVEPTATSTPTFVPWTPTPPATLVPVKPTDKPTTVPPPVNCSDYKTSGECLDHSQCEWIDPATAEGYCQATP